MRNLNYIVIIMVAFFNPTNYSYAAEDGTLTCTLTTTNITFSSYNPYDATVEKANGTAKVVCKSTNSAALNVAYSIQFSSGVSGNQSARLVKNGTSSVSYNIFKDSAFTQILGDGTSSTYTLTKATFSLAANGTNTTSFTVYGRVPVQPLSKAMIYTDNITATISYSY